MSKINKKIRIRYLDRGEEYAKRYLWKKNVRKIT